MVFNPDEIILWQDGLATVNATLGFTWVVMLILVLSAAGIGRRLSSEARISPWQNFLETVVITIHDQIQSVGQRQPERYLPFIGTLFLFIALSNLLAVIPGFRPPTASLSTTAALALCVFIAVPVFGIAESGLAAYLREYLKPTVFMLPFNIIGELSRTLALAVRLYGNMMSGAVIAAILLSIAPFFFPVVMQALGLLTGMIQAYIFAALAMVYIASATAAHRREIPKLTQKPISISKRRGDQA